MAKIVAQEDARVGLQGMGIGKEPALRTRVPGSILTQMGINDGDYIRWSLYDDGHLVGHPIEASEAQPRSIQERAATAAAKRPASAGKKAASKKPAPKKAATGLDDAFGGGEDEDDGSEPAPVRRRPVAIGSTAAKKTLPARPAAAASKKQVPATTKRPTVLPATGARQSRVQGSLPKPGARKRSAVRYDDDE